jgi:hypothetical protein
LRFFVCVCVCVLSMELWFCKWAAAPSSERSPRPFRRGDVCRRATCSPSPPRALAAAANSPAPTTCGSCGSCGWRTAFLRPESHLDDELGVALARVAVARAPKRKVLEPPLQEPQQNRLALRRGVGVRRPRHHKRVVEIAKAVGRQKRRFDIGLGLLLLEAHLLKKKPRGDDRSHGVMGIYAFAFCVVLNVTC